MKIILLTGASGFLGGNFCRFYSADYIIYAAFFHNTVTQEHLNPVKIDLSDVTSIEKLFDEIKFDHVVHLAANSDPNFCELHPQESYNNNVVATKNLAHICRSQKIPLLLASTDLVFDGENAPYKEADIDKPIMKYGRQKAEAEQIVLKANPNINITVRLPLLYGNTYNSGKSFIQQILQKLGNKED
ncbi:MAG: SDR family oxidoreductase, partial [Bacteroidia bacterium]